MPSTTDIGRELEEYVAKEIRDKGIDLKAKREWGSGRGTKEKGDVITSMMILGQNAGIECKAAASLCVGDWWKQTKKLESLGREPMLVFKNMLEPLSDTKCVVYLDTILELIKRASSTSLNKAGKVKVPRVDSTVMWKFQSALSSLKAVKDHLDNLNAD
jgi:hypothetical protein